MTLHLLIQFRSMFDSFKNLVTFYQKTIICRGEMLFSRAKKCGFSSKKPRHSKGKPMIFFQRYSFSTLHRSNFTESHVTPRKHANSKKSIILGDLAFFVEGHCTRSVNLHYIREILKMNFRSSILIPMISSIQDGFSALRGNTPADTRTM